MRVLPGWMLYTFTPPLTDPTKASVQLGWKPRVTFEELVLRMYEHDLADEAARARR